MSCFVVSNKHINTLVDLALRGPHCPWDNDWNRGGRFSYFYEGEKLFVDHNTTDRTALMLLRENEMSYLHRYEDCSDRLTTTFKFRQPDDRIDVVSALKQIQCYKYQACEHPEWGDSSAYHFCYALEQHLIRFLPTYENAPWGIDEDSDGENTTEHAVLIYPPHGCAYTVLYDTLVTAPLFNAWADALLDDFSPCPWDNESWSLIEECSEERKESILKIAQFFQIDVDEFERSVSWYA